MKALTGSEEATASEIKRSLPYCGRSLSPRSVSATSLSLPLRLSTSRLRACVRVSSPRTVSYTHSGFLLFLHRRHLGRLPSHCQHRSVTLEARTVGGTDAWAYRQFTASARITCCLYGAASLSLPTGKRHRKSMRRHLMLGWIRLLLCRVSLAAARAGQTEIDGSIMHSENSGGWEPTTRHRTFWVCVVRSTRRLRHTCTALV